MRPLIVPQPVTTPSPGTLGLLHAEIDAAVLDIHVELLERVLVEQELEPLARRELATLVLRLGARRAAAGAGPVAADFKLFQDFFHAGSRCDAAVNGQ